MDVVNKEACIEKICNLPVIFKSANKSSFLLLKESGFENLCKVITRRDVVDYFSQHESLISSWEMWSWDKRSGGYYLSIGDGEYRVGSEYFETPEEACAEFALKEVSMILGVDKW